MEAVTMPSRRTPVTHWDGCYKDGWRGLIVSDAQTPEAQGALFARGDDYNAYEHPAKVSRALIKRIYTHLAAHYGLRPGMVVLDPFAGVGLHGLDALLLGYHFIGVELEPKHHTVSLKNLEYWRHKFGAQPGSVRLLQGDSRALSAVLGKADCLVSSPPYASTDTKPTALGSGKGTRSLGDGAGRNKGDYHYADSAGQLGIMPEGSLDATLISSPPYAEGCAHTGGADKHPEHIQGGKQGVGIGYAVSSPPYADSWHAAESTAISEERMRKAGYTESYIKTQFRASKSSGGNLNAQKYGSEPGQLGAMPAGALVSSPPYEQSVTVGHAPEKDMARALAAGHTLASLGNPGGQLRYAFEYGTDANQLGNKHGETFWSAASQVMAECYAVLAPGAITAWIVKAFVRQKAIVDFPGQWQALCEHHGFVLVERIEASLITHHGTEETFWGETVTRASKKRSFFRSLAEKKGSPPIDAEVVLICQKR